MRTEAHEGGTGNSGHGPSLLLLESAARESIAGDERGGTGQPATPERVDLFTGRGCGRQGDAAGKGGGAGDPPRRRTSLPASPSSAAAGRKTPRCSALLRLRRASRANGKGRRKISTPCPCASSHSPSLRLCPLLLPLPLWRTRRMTGFFLPWFDRFF